MSSALNLTFKWHKFRIDKRDGFKWCNRVLPPEAKLIHGDGEVPGLIVAVVQVAVVHRDEVHVTEDEAVVRGLLQGLPVADVQQLGPVESVFAQLWKHTHTHKNGVIPSLDEQEDVFLFSDPARKTCAVV